MNKESRTFMEVEDFESMFAQASDVIKHETHDQKTHGSWADSGSPKLTIMGKNQGENKFFNENTRVVRFQSEGKAPVDYVLVVDDLFSTSSVVAYLRPTDGTEIDGNPEGGFGNYKQKPVGVLEATGAGANPWRESAKNDNKGTVVSLTVNASHRRRGLASAMLKFHRDTYPELDIQHSHALTEDGQAFATVVKHATHDQKTHGSWANTLVGNQTLLGTTVTSIIDKLSEKDTPGFTIDIRTKTSPKDGFIASDSGAERTLDWAKVSSSRENLRNEIVDYVIDHAELLDGAGAFFGGWIEEGVLYLDVSRRYTSRSEGVRAGFKNGQKAIYDVVKDLYIYMKDEVDERTNKARSGGSSEASQGNDPTGIGSLRRRDGGSPTGQKVSFPHICLGRYSVVAVQKHEQHDQKTHGSWANNSGIPAMWGTSSIPEGHVRLFHQTGGDVANLIGSEGIKIDSARFNEGHPTGIFSSKMQGSGIEASGWYGKFKDMPTVEFHVPKEWTNQSDSGIIFRDVPQKNIIAVHQPWHSIVRSIVERGIVEDVRAGKYDYGNSDPSFKQATNYIKQTPIQKHLEGQHDQATHGNWAGDRYSADSVKSARDGAKEYAFKKGLNPDETIDYTKVVANRERASKIADIYEKLPKMDRDAIDEYEALASEVEEQFDYMTKTLGVKVEFVTDDPYKTSKEMFNDVSKGSLKVLSTATTGAHPIFSDEQNNKFRAVHDYFGHAATGRGFGQDGEESAWVHHSQMFTQKATAALTTETRGQNSFFNNRGKQFADQKVALLPEEFWAVPNVFQKRYQVIYFAPGLKPVLKHEQHDQSDHGNWADGGGTARELLLSQASKFETFEEFSFAVSQDGLRPKMWHIAGDDFQLNPNLKPMSRIGGTSDEAGLFVGDPETWQDYAASRKTVIEYDMTKLTYSKNSSADYSSDKSGNQGFFVKPSGFSKLKEVGRFTVQEAISRARKQQNEMPKSKEEARKIWEESRSVAKHGTGDQKPHGNWAHGSSFGDFTLDEGADSTKLATYSHPNGTRVIFQNLSKVESSSPMVKETLENISDLSKKYPIPNLTFVVQSGEGGGIIPRGYDGFCYSQSGSKKYTERIESWLRYKNMPEARDITAPYIAIRQRVLAPDSAPKTTPLAGGGLLIRPTKTQEQKTAYLKELITHEWGHALDTRTNAISSAQFRNRDTSSTSNYGNKNGREFFAETFAASELGGLVYDRPDNIPNYKKASEYLQISSLKDKVSKESFEGFICYENFETGEPLLIEDGLPLEFNEDVAKHGEGDQKPHGNWADGSADGHKAGNGLSFEEIVALHSNSDPLQQKIYDAEKVIRKSPKNKLEQPIAPKWKDYDGIGVSNKGNRDDYDRVAKEYNKKWIAWARDEQANILTDRGNDLLSGTPAGVKKYVEQVIKQDWFVKKFGNGKSLPPLDIKTGDIPVAGRHELGFVKSAWSGEIVRKIHSITIGSQFTKDEATILHEVSHYATVISQTKPFSGHGVEFAQNFVYVVGKAVGDAYASKLKEAYSSKGVKIGN